VKLVIIIHVFKNSDIGLHKNPTDSLFADNGSQQTGRGIEVWQ
jgi:hypothetical protein